MLHKWVERFPSKRLGQLLCPNGFIVELVEKKNNLIFFLDNLDYLKRFYDFTDPSV